MTPPQVQKQSGAQAAPKTFLYVQYLRGIAALLVVYFHTKIYDPQLTWSVDRSFGYGGVDIFFVISGFIMTLNNYDAPQPPGRFLINRFLRIYPPYWVATTVGVLLFLAVPSAFLKDKIDLPYVIYSYALLPLENASGTSHGVPFLKIAWTLVFEIYFYAVFAATLIIPGPVNRFLMQTVFIVGMVVYGLLAHPTSAPMGFFTHPMTLEFLFGCLTGLLVGGRVLVLPRWLFAGLIVLCTAIFLVGGGHGDFLMRVVHFGLPAMGLVLFAASSEAAYGPFARSRSLRLIGDASYSIYLFHPFFLTAVRIVAGRLLHGEKATPVVGAVGVVAAVVLCGAAGTAIYLLIEKPMLRLLRKVIPRRSRKSEVRTVNTAPV